MTTRKVKPGSSLRIEIHLTEFMVREARLSLSEVGLLVGMLMSEAAGIHVADPTGGYLARVWSERDQYRVIRGSFGRNGVRLSVLRAVFERDGGTCRYCQRDIEWTEYHCDHSVPVSKGGSDDIENLVSSCVKCNLSKSAKLPSEWRQ